MKVRVKVPLMDICQRSSPSEIKIITLFYSEKIPLYRKHGIFRENSIHK